MTSISKYASSAFGLPKWIIDANAPVRAADDLAGRVAADDELAGCSSALRQSGFMETERELDDVRNPFAGQTLALFILERIGVAACREETLLEVISANDPEVLRGNGLRVLAHRRQ
jgi:hypothetical protein